MKNILSLVSGNVGNLLRQLGTPPNQGLASQSLFLTLSSFGVSIMCSRGHFLPIYSLTRSFGRPVDPSDSRPLSNSALTLSSRIPGAVRHCSDSEVSNLAMHRSFGLCSTKGRAVTNCRANKYLESSKSKSFALAPLVCLRPKSHVHPCFPSRREGGQDSRRAYK